MVIKHRLVSEHSKDEMSAFPDFAIHFAQPNACILDCNRILIVRPNLDLEMGLQKKIHILKYNGKGKGKVHPGRGHEGAVEE
jgi:hypothetical protein